MHIKIIPCGTSSQAIKIISSPRFQVNEALIINTGVNDVEQLKLDEVIQKQLEMVDTAMKAFPGKKIIVSSVTPRDDDFDEDIWAINRTIQSEISNSTDVIYVNNDNLRDRALYFDRKSGIGVFVGLQRTSRKQLEWQVALWTTSHVIHPIIVMICIRSDLMIVLHTLNLVMEAL